MTKTPEKSEERTPSCASDGRIFWRESLHHEAQDWWSFDEYVEGHGEVTFHAVHDLADAAAEDEKVFGRFVKNVFLLQDLVSWWVNTARCYIVYLQYPEDSIFVRESLDPEPFRERGLPVIHSYYNYAWHNFFMELKVISAALDLRTDFRVDPSPLWDFSKSPTSRRAKGRMIERF